MTDRIEKRIELKASVSRVWRALTDHREFGQWFRIVLEGPFEVGKVARGTKLDPCNGQVVFAATIKEMQPERLFSFTWRPYAVDPKIDYSQEPPTLVEFTLEKSAAGTVLTVVESGFDKIPEARRAQALRMNNAGWDAQLQNIERHVS